jgi:hypothetical protein
MSVGVVMGDISAMQLIVLTDKSSFPHLKLQTEHTWL